MESSTSVALPNLTSLTRTVTKAFGLRRAAMSSTFNNEEDIVIQRRKQKQNLSFSPETSLVDKVDQDKKQKQGSETDEDAIESLLANLFTSVSAIKASYCELQTAQVPYDPDRIQSTDSAIVSELKAISELKKTYRRKPPPLDSINAKINEHRNLVKTYQITIRKLEDNLELHDNKFLSLQAQLLEFEQQNRALQVKLHPRRSLAALDDLHLSGLNSTHFLTLLRYTFESIRSFTSQLMKEMESAGWDLDIAAATIQPDIRPRHRRYAFESFVSQRMFSDFHLKSFNIASFDDDRWKWEGPQFFDEFKKLNCSNPHHCSIFSDFCGTKYSSVVHPKLESSIFRETVRSGEGKLLDEFWEMARRVWLLHCLFFSFEPGSDRSVFQVGRGARFSEVYMERVCADTDDSVYRYGQLRVAFSVVPGFRIGRTVIQSKVYLSSGCLKTN